MKEHLVIMRGNRYLASLKNALPLYITCRCLGNPFIFRGFMAGANGYFFNA
jgi:hypothetical protein